MLTKSVRIKILTAATMLTAMIVAGTRDANAADHRESPILAGPFLLSAEDSASVVDFLDSLGIEPVDLPPRQTREHILLARVSRSNTGTSRDGGIDFYVLNRSQGQLLLLMLTLLDDHDRDIDWADGMFIRYPAGTTDQGDGGTRIARFRDSR